MSAAESIIVGVICWSALALCSWAAVAFLVPAGTVPPGIVDMTLRARGRATRASNFIGYVALALGSQIVIIVAAVEERYRAAPLAMELVPAIVWLGYLLRRYRRYLSSNIARWRIG